MLSPLCIRSNASLINGKIAVIDRGACYFATKTVNAQKAGAKLLIIINNIDGPPVGMASPTDGSVDLNYCLRTSINAGADGLGVQPLVRQRWL